MKTRSMKENDHENDHETRIMMENDHENDHEKMCHDRLRAKHKL